MENASKALIMAGGILLAILLISLLISVYTKMNGIQNVQEQIKETEQIHKFNAKYESYNKETVYGSEIYTLQNKAKDDNAKYGLNIVISVNGNVNYNFSDSTSREQKFKCINISYEDGKVKLLAFESQ